MIFGLSIVGLESVKIIDNMGGIEYLIDNSIKIHDTFESSSGILVRLDTAKGIGKKTLTHIMEQPAVLTQNRQDVWVCSPDENSVCSRRYSSPFQDLSDFKDTGGYTSLSDKVIYLNASNPAAQQNLTHELMHRYCLTYGLTRTEEARSLYIKHKDIFGDYGARNTDEFLAEAARLFFHSPEVLQRSDSREVFMYLNKIFYQKPPVLLKGEQEINGFRIEIDAPGGVSDYLLADVFSLKDTYKKKLPKEIRILEPEDDGYRLENGNVLGPDFSFNIENDRLLLNSRSLSSETVRSALDTWRLQKNSKKNK